MTFTRDFDTSTPIDHTLNSNWPAQIRSIKDDLGDRLGDIISGFNTGETAKGVKVLPMITGSAPTEVADQVQVYAKDVSGKAELHAKDEDGNEVQITSGGSIAGLTGTALLAAVGPYIMPVGFVVTLGVSTNPATLFGFGTWTAIAGKVIVGLNAAETEFDTLNETGGEKTHTLTVDEMPAHTHSVSTRNSDGYGTTVQNSDAQNQAESPNTGSTGGGQAHNNLQPYIVKYVWERTA